jgi:glycosyltransferase involved in cell wall biosynthesis
MEDRSDRTPAARPYLIDVSRLVWRFWTRRLPTGIDRVCLAYLDHYGERAQAVVQRRGRRLILSPRHSDRLFALLRRGRGASKAALVSLILAAIAAPQRAAANAFYFNVGHTGLDEPSLPAWVAGNRLRAISLVHDLIPLTHPQYCRPGEGAKHDLRMANLLKSHGVIANSQATLDELARFAAATGKPVPSSVVAWISGPETVRAVTPAPLATPYFVTLGTIEGRKNHLLLLQAWRRMIEQLGDGAPTLVIIGQRGWEADSVLALLDEPGAFGGKVVELNDCSDEEAAGWIAGARALLMPSHVEGFGLPLIEAIVLGAPIIASDLPVFREIAGEIPLFLDPGDPAVWEGAITRFVGDDPERQRQLALMNGYRAPSWKQHFAIVDRWLATL